MISSRDPFCRAHSVGISLLDDPKFSVPPPSRGCGREIYCFPAAATSARIFCELILALGCSLYALDRLLCKKAVLRV